jgi:lipoyl-dependent peroxiredoxin
MKRNATARWSGSGKEGNGLLSTQTGVMKDTPYNFISRFGEGTHTNPEELLAAAHAGCFSMKLAFVIGEAGQTPEWIETKCTITLDNGAITASHLEVQVKTTLNEEEFAACIENAKANCPVSKLFNTTITAHATLA